MEKVLSFMLALVLVVGVGSIAPKENSIIVVNAEEVAEKTTINEELKGLVTDYLGDGSGYSKHRLFYKVNVNRLVKFTIEELRDVLEVVDHDWLEQAKMTVNTKYLSKGEGYSRFKLIENLSFDGEPYSYGYTHEDAVQAVDEMGIDFFAEAVLRAKYLKNTPEPGYIAHGDMVCFHRFTHEQTNAAMIEVYGQLGLTPSIVIKDKVITFGETTTLVAETRGHSYDPYPRDYEFNFKWTNITTDEILKDGISGFREGYPHIGRDTLEVTPIADTTYRINVVDVCGFHIEKEVKVTVNPVITEEEIIETVEIPFITIYEDDPTLELGEEVVKREGVIGIETITIKVTTTNGVESRDEISRVQDPLKVDKIILRGTKKPVVDPVDPEPAEPVIPDVPTDPLAPTEPKTPTEEAKEDFGVLGAEKPKEISKTPATSISNDALLYRTTLMTSLGGLYVIRKRKKK